MKIEKLTENKIRVIVSTEDLIKTNTDLNSIMAKAIESQKLFLEILSRAEKEVDFHTEGCKLLIEAFSSIDDFTFFYATQIGHNPEKHKEIMELLSWAKESGHINFGITSFVVSNQWKALEELKNNPDLIPTASNICTVDE